jgi:hypothetical protein
MLHFFLRQLINAQTEEITRHAKQSTANHRNSVDVGLTGRFKR